MNPTLARITILTIAIGACYPAIGRAQGKVASWLDEAGVMEHVLGVHPRRTKDSENGRLTAEYERYAASDPLC